MASAGAEESAGIGVRVGNIIAVDEWSQRTAPESARKNRTKTARGLSRTWASSTWTLTLVCVATAVALRVQIARAQERGGATVTVSPVPMMHVVLPGPAPAGEPHISSSLDNGAPVPGAPHAVSAGLTIIPTFDATITNDPNAAAIEATINAAIATIESQFSDPITVNVTFQKMGSGLGASGAYYANLPYSTFLGALKNDAKTSDDSTAVGQLPNLPANPVSGTSTINVKLANLRAIGINVNPPSGQPDGFIYLNTAITSPGSPGSTGVVNLLPVVLHEIDEVLGLGSALPSVPSCGSIPATCTIFPEDLYRYSGANTRTFTANDSRSSGVFAYFSIDALNALAEFDNQNDGGDFGDWQANPRRAGVGPKVQDAFATAFANPAMSVELTALDVIGYDRVFPVLTANSVTPNAGTGATQAFALVYGDTVGAADLQQAWVWFNPTFSSSAANSCMAYYERATNTLKLLGDDGATWILGSLGSSGTLQNGQCAIALGSSTAVPSGNTLTLTLALTFEPRLGGTQQSVFMYATNGAQTSGWQTRGTWTVPTSAATPVVTADSVTPNAGNGATQAFALAYGDTAGLAELQQVWVWFNPTFATSAAHSCMAYYLRGTNTLKLLDDAGATWLSAALGSSGTLQNSQCAIDLGHSTVQPNGNTLTLTLVVMFTPAFAGTQSIFMYATNGLQTSGWQTRGTWTVPAPATPVTADSVTPNSGTGTTQSFALAYGDTAGATDLQQVWVWFNPTFASSAAHSCMAYYQRGTNTLNLIDDAGATWQSAPLGSGGTLQNSQCAITLASSTAVPSGNTLTLTLGMTFTSAFGGTQSIFMYATNGTQTSGWQTRGTWTVPGPVVSVVTADAVTPNAGTGATQAFALSYGDTAGAMDLQQLWVWFNPTFATSAAHSCMAYYLPGTNTLKLLDDTGATWQSALLGSGTLQNSQCTINLGSSTAVPNGNALTLTVAVTFTPAFAGAQSIFMYATNGTQTSGWQTRGTWTVPAPVTADSVAPNAGTGATQAFVLSYGDTAGAMDLQQLWVWFNPTFAASAAHSCMAYYQRATNTLNLIDDAGATWQSAPLGSAVTLQNNQCGITLGSSTVVPSGNTLTLTLAVTFTPAFSGTQTIFMYATNGAQASGWKTRGTWTAPGPVTADSVTPNAGMGPMQAFALAYGDTAGAMDLQQVWVWFNPTFASSAAHSCMAYYLPRTNTLKLLDDTGATWLSAPLGSGTLQNSQCAIDLGSSTAVPSGNTLTLTLALTFTQVFTGTQTIFMYATNGAQASGWQTRGTWTSGTVTGDCVTSVLPSTADYSAELHQGTVSVTAPSDCQWSAVGLSPFITFNSLAAQGTGNGSFTYRVFGNLSGAPRSGSLKVGPQTITVTQHAALGGNYLSFVSDPGDYIGQGWTLLHEAPTSMFTPTLDAPQNHLSFQISGSDGLSPLTWTLDLAAPQGQQLTPGTYVNASRYPFQAPTVPGLSFWGDGRGCNTLSGTFTITDAAYGTDGSVQRLSATFEQHCEGAGPALRGTIAYVR